MKTKAIFQAGLLLFLCIEAPGSRHFGPVFSVFSNKSGCISEYFHASSATRALNSEDKSKLQTTLLLFPALFAEVGSFLPSP